MLSRRMKWDHPRLTDYCDVRADSIMRSVTYLAGLKPRHLEQRLGEIESQVRARIDALTTEQTVVAAALMTNDVWVAMNIIEQWEARWTPIVKAYLERTCGLVVEAADGAGVPIRFLIDNHCPDLSRFELLFVPWMSASGLVPICAPLFGNDVVQGFLDSAQHDDRIARANVADAFKEDCRRGSVSFVHLHTEPGDHPFELDLQRAPQDRSLTVLQSDSPAPGCALQFFAPPSLGIDRVLGR